MALPIRTRPSFPLRLSLPSGSFHKPSYPSSHVRLFATPMDGSLPGSTVHGIFQARIREWVAISFSRGSSQPKDRTQVSCIAGRRFTIWATREAPSKGRQAENHNHKKLTNLITQTTALSNSVKPWAMPCRAIQDGRVLVESPDKTWSTEEVNGKPLQYSCLENPMNATYG